MSSIHADKKDKRVQYLVRSVTIFQIRVSILNVGFIQIPFVRVNRCDKGMDMIYCVHYLLLLVYVGNN